jgi:hypothetical protein
MTKLFKITALKKAQEALIGMKIPKLDSGNIGRLIERVIESLGYTLNKGAGPDLPQWEVEIKSTVWPTNSSRSIGLMTFTDIINTSYENSLIYKKLQQQFVVKHCRTTMVITEAKMYDFRDPEIQAKFKDAYESTRSVLATYQPGHYPKDVKVVGKCGYWEFKGSNNFKFRILPAAMKKIEQQVDTEKARSMLF